MSGGTIVMRRWQWTALRRGMFALALAALCSGTADAGAVSGIGADGTTLQRALREHTLRSLDGKILTLDALHGEVVVVNFWASWCTPCRRELTRLDALNTEIARRGGRVVAISVDEDVANARRFAARQRLKMTVVHDGPQGLARTLDLDHLPFTMVLDREGQVAFTTLGASEASVQGLVERTQQLVATHPVVAEGETR
jgi:peroxiredoxin